MINDKLQKPKRQHWFSVTKPKLVQTQVLIYKLKMNLQTLTFSNYNMNKSLSIKPRNESVNTKLQISQRFRRHFEKCEQHGYIERESLPRHVELPWKLSKSKSSFLNLQTKVKKHSIQKWFVMKRNRCQQEESWRVTNKTQIEIRTK